MDPSRQAFVLKGQVEAVEKEVVMEMTTMTFSQPAGLAEVRQKSNQ
jgi:hypothetical protein